jgi:superfamily I DNA/RNA helicase
MIKGGQDVLGLLRPEHHDRYLARDLEWLAASVLPKYERPARFAARVIERLGSAALTKEPAITVGTIHSVKGGEAETVYLFPDVSQAGWIEMHGSTEGHDAAVRLGYVGMTRASERLVLCTAVDAKRGLW